MMYSNVDTGALPRLLASADMDTTVEIVDQPGKYDVLCGKDKSLNKHYGNRLFRAVVKSYLDIYNNKAETKGDKMKITKEIVYRLQITYNSRFLKPLENGKWEEIADEKARDKVSHALRFATRAERAAGSSSPCTGGNKSPTKKRRGPETLDIRFVEPQPIRGTGFTRKSTLKLALPGLIDSLNMTSAAVSSYESDRATLPPRISSSSSLSSQQLPNLVGSSRNWAPVMATQQSMTSMVNPLRAASTPVSACPTPPAAETSRISGMTLFSAASVAGVFDSQDAEGDLSTLLMTEIADFNMDQPAAESLDVMGAFLDEDVTARGQC